MSCDVSVVTREGLSESGKNVEEKFLDNSFKFLEIQVALRATIEESRLIRTELRETHLQAKQYRFIAKLDSETYSRQNMLPDK